MFSAKFIKLCLILFLSCLSNSYASSVDPVEVPKNPLKSIVCLHVPVEIPTEATPIVNSFVSSEDKQEDSYFSIPVNASDPSRIQKIARNLNGCLKTYDMMTGFFLELLSRPARTISLAAGSGAIVTSTIAYVSGYDGNLINIIFTTIGVTATAISHGAHTEAIKRVNALIYQNK